MRLGWAWGKKTSSRKRKLTELRKRKKIVTCAHLVSTGIGTKEKGTLVGALSLCPCHTICTDQISNQPHKMCAQWTNSNQHTIHWKPIMTRLWIEPHLNWPPGFTKCLTYVVNNIKSSAVSCVQKQNYNRVILKVRRSGARMASFSIIRHQTHNWEWKFYKRK